METVEEKTENSNFDVPPDIIQPIKATTVHRICSGQVVLSLAIAVKELVENAIDVKATKIDVRLREYGSELVEVSDNGSGVKHENFQALTLKHHTSKIREFSDLESVETLGFRGEALSSLCALSDLSITTKHCDVDIGNKIMYDHEGNIMSNVPVARETGTTVCLTNLFSTLPVRRKEFLKNLKREFSKMCQLLYAYCLVSKGIRFTCTNQASKGSANTVVATEGSATIRENIISVFGPKQISSLVEIELVRPEESMLKEYNLTLAPGDPLNFTFEFFVSSVTHGCGRSSTDRQFYYINARPCEPTKLMKLVNEIYRQFNNSQYPFVYLNVITERSDIDVNVTPDKRQIFLSKEKLLLATIKASLVEAFKTFPSTFKLQNLAVSKVSNEFAEDKLCRGFKRGFSDGKIVEANRELKRESLFETFRKKSKTEGNIGVVEDDKRKSNTKSSNSSILSSARCLDDKPHAKVENREDTNIEIEPVKENNTAEAEVDKIIMLDEETTKPSKQEITIHVSIEDIRKKINSSRDKAQKDNILVKFRTKISPDSNEVAEKELQRQISKPMFKEMEIIGQFNHGFIITKLGGDLFIIDQHASDEKYNFEQLQLSTVLEHQVLVNPKPLELTAANESILIENEEVFKKNGFAFKINPEAPCTKKVQLTGIPISKNCIFGKDDIDEMLFMLQDASNTMCRPSRVRAMFASRACRKSVMVGKALSFADMRRLVDHMGQIEQPWNCPHGRPTMRHLINLNLIQND